jgi:predicted HNH restriction endonuclease
VLHVHHIRPYKEFNGNYWEANDLRNLITLCYTCHHKVERSGLPCPQPLL